MSVVILEQVMDMNVTGVIDHHKDVIELTLGAETVTVAIEGQSEFWGVINLGGRDLGVNFYEDDDDSSVLNLYISSLMVNEDTKYSYDPSYMKAVPFNAFPLPEKLKTSKILELCDGCGSTDKLVTKELLTHYGIEFTIDNGQIEPLSDKEISFMFIGEGMDLANNGWSRSTHMVLINGIKCINFAMDDTYEPIESVERLVEYRNNYKIAQEVYTEISEAFGVDLEFNIHEENNFFADVFIPVSVFDFIESAEELQTYFVERKYLTCPHALKHKERNA